jgi:hypothetical protein
MNINNIMNKNNFKTNVKIYKNLKIKLVKNKFFKIKMMNKFK